MKRVYEMKNNCWLFEMLFKIQENGAFLLEMSLFALKIQRILHRSEKIWILCSSGKNNSSRVRAANEWDIVFATIT